MTSALYALALVPALMCDGARLRARLLALGVIVVAGCVFVLVAGPWYWQVWQHLGNPLFPQFNGLFKSPLAAPVSIADTRWLPRNLGEHLLWPLLFTLKPQRIGDLGLVQALWAVLYALVLIVAARAVLRCRVAGVGLDRSATVVLVFVAHGLCVVAGHLQHPPLSGRAGIAGAGGAVDLLPACVCATCRSQGCVVDRAVRAGGGGRLEGLGVRALGARGV
ncbi:hypothetical protein Xcc1_32000 [Xanthomonas campestris pv. campestris]|nr:hypothetical protein Xcc1_32000 [Xanthomonas campestris pv. campestris]